MISVERVPGRGGKQGGKGELILSYWLGDQQYLGLINIHSKINNMNGFIKLMLFPLHKNNNFALLL